MLTTENDPASARSLRNSLRNHVSKYLMSPHHARTALCTHRHFFNAFGWVSDSKFLAPLHYLFSGICIKAFHFTKSTLFKNLAWWFHLRLPLSLKWEHSVTKSQVRADIPHFNSSPIIPNYLEFQSTVLLSNPVDSTVHTSIPQQQIQPTSGWKIFEKILHMLWTCKYFFQVIIS